MATRNPPGPDKNATIYVNTRAHEWDDPTITFEQVVALAFPNGGQVYTVTYSGGKGGKDGTLLPGKHVPVEDGMAFDVTATTKS